MKKYHKQGSVIAITLVFIAIIMATVIGVSFLIAKLLSSGSLVVDGIKAGYHAESGLEVALYQLKVRREGFEDQRNLDIADGKSSYKIQYKTPPLKEMPHTFAKGNDTLSLALYRDIPPAIVDINEAPYDIKLNLQQTTPTSLTSCAKVRLIGRIGDTYEAISKTYNCHQGNTPVSIRGDLDDSVRLLSGSTTSISFDEFIRTHEEIKIEIKDLKQETNNPLKLVLVTGTGSSSKDIASIRKTVEAEGTSGSVTVKKRAENMQDQVLGLLTNSFSWTN